MDVETRRPMVSAVAPPRTPLPAPQRPGWRTADILRAAALVMGLWLALRLLWVAYPLLFTAFLGVLFGLVVARGADQLQRFRIPRGLGSAIIVLGFVGLLVGLGFWMGPTLRGQLGELRTAVPQSLDKIEGWLGRHQDGLIGQMLPMDPATPAPAATQPAPDQAASAAPPAGQPAAPTPETPPNQLSKLPETLS